MAERARRPELVGLLAASLLTVAGLVLVSAARQDGLRDTEDALAAGRMVESRPTGPLRTALAVARAGRGRPGRAPVRGRPDRRLGQHAGEGRDPAARAVRRRLAERHHPHRAGSPAQAPPADTQGALRGAARSAVGQPGRDQHSDPTADRRAAVGGTPCGRRQVAIRVPRNPVVVGGPLPAALLRRARVAASSPVDRRSLPAPAHARPVRRRLRDDGQPQGPAARSDAVRAIRAGCRRRLPGARRGRVVRLRALGRPAPGLPAAGRRGLPLVAADRIRQRPRHERREGEPDGRATSRGNPRARHAVSRRPLRASVEGPARG